MIQNAQQPDHLHAYAPCGWLIILALTLVACGPTGNRLNQGVILDPRQQFDPNSTTGNQGTITPTDAANAATVVDPALTPIPGGGGGASSSTNTNTQNSGTPGGIFQYSETSNLSFVDTDWNLRLNRDGLFVLAARYSNISSPSDNYSGNWRSTPGTGLTLLPDAPNGTALAGAFFNASLLDRRLAIFQGLAPVSSDLTWMTGSTSCPTRRVQGNWVNLTPGRLSSDIGGTLTYYPETSQATNTLVIDRYGVVRPSFAEPYVNGNCLVARRVSGVRSLKSVPGTNSLPNLRAEISDAGFGTLKGPAVHALMLPVTETQGIKGFSGHFSGLMQSGQIVSSIDARCDEFGQCIAHSSMDTNEHLLAITSINDPANGILTASWHTSNAKATGGHHSRIICISSSNQARGVSTEVLACRNIYGSPYLGLILLRQS